MMQILFSSLAVLVVTALHFLVWLFWRDMFSLSQFYSQLSLYIIGFFYVSTALASVLVHRYDRKIFRYYYLVAGTWIGLIVNYALAFIVVFYLRLFLSSFFTLGYIFPVLVLVITLAFSFYGIRNAFVPKITRYKAKILDLPKYWWGKEIVQISDLHLGPVYRKKSLDKAINVVNRLKPEVVCITGDLFDGMDTEFSWLQDPFKRLETKLGAYYSFGNHDLFLGFNRVHKLLEDSQVKILDNKLVTLKGLQFIGINYSFNRDFDLYQAILAQVGYTEEKPSILLYHEPRNTRYAKEAGIDLQLSGHTHRGQIFPLNILVNLIYRGFGYGHFIKDGYNLVVSSGLGTWGPAMRTSGQSEIVLIELQPLK